MRLPPSTSRRTPGREGHQGRRCTSRRRGCKALRGSVDQFKRKLGDCVVLLAGGADGKVALVAGTRQRLGQDQGRWLVATASQIGGKGGGRADMAQGGGEDSPRLTAALDAVPGWVAERLA
jgi:alanyl-tRNA synthetase